MKVTEALSEAQSLFRSDDREDTVIALVIVLVVLGPVLWRLYEMQKTVRT